MQYQIAKGGSLLLGWVEWQNHRCRNSLQSYAYHIDMVSIDHCDSIFPICQDAFLTHAINSRHECDRPTTRIYAEYVPIIQSSSEGISAAWWHNYKHKSLVRDRYPIWLLCVRKRVGSLAFNEQALDPVAHCVGWNACTSSVGKRNLYFNYWISFNSKTSSRSSVTAYKGILGHVVYLIPGSMTISIPYYIQSFSIGLLQDQQMASHMHSLNHPQIRMGIERDMIAYPVICAAKRW